MKREPTFVSNGLIAKKIVAKNKYRPHIPKDM